MFSHKLVTPLSIINTMLVSPAWVNPSFWWLGRHAPSKTVYCYHGVYHRRIISNAVLQVISLSMSLMLNELQSECPINISMIFYITVMYVLSFSAPFEMFSMIFYITVILRLASQLNGATKLGNRGELVVTSNFLAFETI